MSNVYNTRLHGILRCRNQRNSAMWRTIEYCNGCDTVRARRVRLHYAMHARGSEHTRAHLPCPLYARGCPHNFKWVLALLCGGPLNIAMVVTLCAHGGCVCIMQRMQEAANILEHTCPAHFIHVGAPTISNGFRRLCIYTIQPCLSTR